MKWLAESHLRHCGYAVGTSDFIVRFSEVESGIAILRLFRPVCVVEFQ